MFANFPNVHNQHNRAITDHLTEKRLFHNKHFHRPVHRAEYIQRLDPHGVVEKGHLILVVVEEALFGPQSFLQATHGLGHQRVGL